MGGKSSKSLMDTVIEVKMVKKQLEMAHRRAEKEHAKEKAKIKRAIEQGNVEGARIYAENAIRKKNEGLNMLRLAAKMDAVASRLDTAEKTQQISDSITNALPQLSAALHKMSPEQMASNMDKFEKIFEDLDVRTGYIVEAVDSTTASTTPATEVDQLIRQVGDEHALDVAEMVTGKHALSAHPGANAIPAPAPAAGNLLADGGDGDLEARLAQLRQPGA